MDIAEQIYNMSTTRESKADVIAYYQSKYTGRGQAGWKQHLIHDVLGSQDITPADVGQIEYNRLRKNMARRFDPSRINNPEPKNAEEYEALGEELPPMPPRGGVNVSGTIYVKYSNDCVERYIDEDNPIHITFNAAQRMVEMEEEAMVQAIANAYQSDEENGDIDFKGPGVGDCGSPELIVEPVEEEE